MFLNLSVLCSIKKKNIICFVLLVSKLYASQFGGRLYFKQGNRNDGIQAGLGSQWCAPFCIIICFSYFSLFFILFLASQFELWCSVVGSCHSWRKPIWPGIIAPLLLWFLDERFSWWNHCAHFCCETVQDGNTEFFVVI